LITVQNKGLISLDEFPALRVERKLGQVALSAAWKLNILNRNFRIMSTDTEVIIPLSKMPSQEDLATLKLELPNLQVSNYSFERRKLRPRSLVEVLYDKLPPDVLASLPRSYDVIGDVAIIEIPESLITYGRTIGEAVRLLNPRIQSVLAKAGPITNTFRVRDFTILAGRQSSVTEYSEYGCVLRLDPSKVYFSPRLSYERQRVASKVRPGEVVVDMFAGAGPFPVIIAGSRNVRKVYGLDVNPEAISFMLQNIELNNLRGKVTVVLADAAATSVELLSSSADRVIMNLPADSMRFIAQACRFLKPEGGVIHFYTFVSGKVSRETTLELIREKVESSGRTVVAIEAIRAIRAVAPREWQFAIDVRVA